MVPFSGGDVTVASGARWPLLLGTLTVIDIMSADLYPPAFPAIARTFDAGTSEVQADRSYFPGYKAQRERQRHVTATAIGPAINECITIINNERASS